MQNPFDPGYYNEHELQEAGFKSIGSNVLIAKNCTIVGLQNISIGDNVRIDGYCSLIAGGNGSIDIGSYIHIAAYVLLSAGAGVTLNDFANLSQGVRVYTRSDDYSGNHLTNPTVPEDYLGVESAAVVIGKHGLLGSGTIVMPGVSVGIGTATGAMTFVSTSLESWGIYVGAPARRIKDRSQKLLELEQRLLNDV
jgi:galactoside O-acetyltransferase